MVVVLVHFNTKVGPVLFMGYPNEMEITQDIEKLKNIMDIKEDEGFIFMDEDTVETRNLNYLFDIDSPISRGNVESLLISYIITETEPDIEFYKEKIIITVNRLKSYDNLYHAFNNNNQIEKNRAREIIYKELSLLDSQLRRKETSTVGYLGNRKLITSNHTIPIPLEEVNGNDFLFVYKRDNKSIKITGIQITSDNVYKAEVYNDKIDWDVYQECVNAFRSLGSDILWASGLCQGQDDVCVFETYFEYEGGMIDIKKMQDELMKTIKSDNPNFPMMTLLKVPYDTHFLENLKIEDKKEKIV